LLFVALQLPMVACLMIFSFSCGLAVCASSSHNKHKPPPPLTPRMNSHVQLAELFATEAVEFDLGAGLPSVVAGEPELSDRTG
jgi:hypothetical protein